MTEYDWEQEQDVSRTLSTVCFTVVKNPDSCFDGYSLTDFEVEAWSLNRWWQFLSDEIPMVYGHEIPIGGGPGEEREVIDARDNRLFVLAEGFGNGAMCSYSIVKGEAWIVCMDYYSTYEIDIFFKCNGSGEIIDEFTLYAGAAADWDGNGDWYNENAVFEYRGEKITMQRYEELRNYYFGG